MFSPDKEREERRKSQFAQFDRKMDTTIMSEMEYINILPDMEKMDMEKMDEDDSSFLKGSFVNNKGEISSSEQ